MNKTNYSRYAAKFLSLFNKKVAPQQSQIPSQKRESVTFYDDHKLHSHYSKKTLE